MTAVSLMKTARSSMTARFFPEEGALDGTVVA
jgi:hypothetical protein